VISYYVFEKDERNLLIMSTIPNNMLLEAYMDSITLDLSYEFIKMLEDELRRRNIEIPQ
jgi:hypothetical protein